MKKFISMTLALIIMLSALSLCAGAISINSGANALRDQFLDGKNSKGEDYVYYSPVKRSTDSTKYPLFIWIHGMKSGDVPRRQVEWYGIWNWVSDEYQAKFKNAGGCFIFAPRDQGVAVNSWEVGDTSSLKRTIDEFVTRFSKNIDTNRIYISGYSTGGSMVWNMLSSYPDYFAAGLPASALVQPTIPAIKKLKNVSVWIFCCDKDPYASAQTISARPIFNQFKSNTNRPSGVRITTFTEAVLANYAKKGDWDNEHYTWEAITHDMHMTDGKVYAHTTTTDATGATIDFSNSGLIDWLSAQSKTGSGSSEPSDSSGSSFGEKLRNFFQMILELLRSILVLLTSLFLLL